jgi:hypothetical protein
LHPGLHEINDDPYRIKTIFLDIFCLSAVHS